MPTGDLKRLLIEAKFFKLKKMTFKLEEILQNREEKTEELPNITGLQIENLDLQDTIKTLKSNLTQTQIQLDEEKLNQKIQKEKHNLTLNQVKKECLDWKFKVEEENKAREELQRLKEENAKLADSVNELEKEVEFAKDICKEYLPHKFYADHANGDIDDDIDTYDDDEELMQNMGFSEDTDYSDNSVDQSSDEFGDSENEFPDNLETKSEEFETSTKNVHFDNMDMGLKVITKGEIFSGIGIILAIFFCYFIMPFQLNDLFPTTNVYAVSLHSLEDGIVHGCWTRHEVKHGMTLNINHTLNSDGPLIVNRYGNVVNEQEITFDFFMRPKEAYVFLFVLKGNLVTAKIEDFDKIIKILERKLNVMQWDIPHNDGHLVLPKFC